MLKVKVFTIFPQLFPGTLGTSVSNRALESGKWQLDVIDIRDFATDKHKSVDEYPYGGGSGMLMRADILGNAIDFHLKASLKESVESPLIILTSARGQTFTQKFAQTIASLPPGRDLYIVCGRFEGVDERFIEYYNAVEINLGKFVLFGGEVAAMAMLEAIVRLLPGVLGNLETVFEESYAVGTEFEDLMEYPQYTMPRVWKGLSVPDVLLSGNHAKIKQWKLEMAKNVTNTNK